MICLVYAQSSVSTVTIVFYTCIWIPIVQMKKIVLKIVGFMFYTSQTDVAYREGMCSADLPVARFEDLDCGSGGSSSSIKVDHEEMCSVCLVEFEREDVVSKLPRCQHVFHRGCIESWPDRNHFTCPLCRSLFLRSPDALPCKMWPSTYYLPP